MKTYQDLLAVGNEESERIRFILGCIDDFKTSDLYKAACDAEQYYLGHNPRIARAEKIVWDMLGNAHIDNVSANHKIFSQYVFNAVTEETQYLLGNGVTFDKSETKNRLGSDFDTKLQQIADDAQVYGVGWGYWYFDTDDNKEKLDVIPFLQFIPLKDEETSTVMAGIRFWQIDEEKPLLFTLYEIDGFTKYIRRSGEKPEVKQEKRSYKQTVTKYSVNIPDEITASENFPAFPIIPLYYINQRSVLYGNQGAVDAYDLMLSKMVNNIDEGNLVYWVLRNCNGMDEADDEAFIANLLKAHVVHADSMSGDGADAEPHVVEAPVDGTETGIKRIKQLLDDNFMVADLDSIRAGNITATQIRAAYQKLDAKTAKFEYNVIDFIQRLFIVAGIDKDETFTFKYDKAVNRTEEITMIMQAAAYLDDDTVTRMLLEAMGKTDIIDEVIGRKEEEGLSRYNLTTAPQNAPVEAE